MTFQTLAFVMTFACSVLGLRFIFAGASILAQWGLDPSAGALVMCRRIGALYLGLALIFFLGRAAVASDLRSAVCLGLGGASVLLAGLGVFEWWAGRVSRGIVVPAVVEAVLGACFVWVWWAGR
jgi:hypothetical protein